MTDSSVSEASSACEIKMSCRQPIGSRPFFHHHMLPGESVDRCRDRSKECTWLRCSQLHEEGQRRSAEEKLHDVTSRTARASLQIVRSRVSLWNFFANRVTFLFLALALAGSCHEA